MVNCLQSSDRIKKRTLPRKQSKKYNTMKLTQVTIQNEEGETSKVDRKDYLRAIVKEHSVEGFSTEELGETTADKVVGHILKALEGEQEIDDIITDRYSELVELMTEDYKRSAQSSADKKAEKAAEKEAKEAEKKKREEEEAAKKLALAATQKEFAVSAAEGASLAAQEFKTEIESLAQHLPKGVTVKSSGSGYGLEFGDDADKSTIGQTLGYLMQKDNNSEFIGNQLTFWIGDTITKTVSLGIFATAKEAAKLIAEVWSEKSGKKIEPASLDQYKRMSERTPVEYRNPKADPTAYLAISTAKAPRKEEKETDAAFKKRLGAFDKDREELQKKLAVGEIIKRKEMVPLVNDMLVKHGMKDAPDPNAPPAVSLTQQAMIFFHTTFALEELLSVQKEGVVMYKENSDLIEITQHELEEMKASAKAHLVNALYSSEKQSLAPKDFIKGYVLKEIMVEVAKDGDGKPIKESQKTKCPVYPAPFFQRPEEKKDEEAKDETPATK